MTLSGNTLVAGAHARLALLYFQRVTNDCQSVIAYPRGKGVGGQVNQPDLGSVI